MFRRGGSHIKKALRLAARASSGSALLEGVKDVRNEILVGGSR